VGYEFESKTEMLGFAPLELLKQAAVYSAEIAGIANATGSIEKGKCANIILWRAI
jgi:imidazolonepropionase-like amidohydrolase